MVIERIVQRSWRRSRGRIQRSFDFDGVNRQRDFWRYHLVYLNLLLLVMVMLLLGKIAVDCVGDGGVGIDGAYGAAAIESSAAVLFCSSGRSRCCEDGGTMT